MEFSPRGFQRGSSRSTAPSGMPDGNDTGSDNSNNQKRPFARQALNQAKNNRKWGKLSLILIALVVLAAAVFLVTSLKNRSGEAGVVDKDNYQAVVLSDGQAYFGKIMSLRKDYLVLEDVFYV